MEHLVRMLPMMMASRSVQVPDSHSGMRIPVEGKGQAAPVLHHGRKNPVISPLLPPWDTSEPRKQQLLQQLPPALNPGLPDKTQTRAKTVPNLPLTSQRTQVPLNQAAGLNRAFFRAM